MEGRRGKENGGFDEECMDKDKKGRKEKQVAKEENQLRGKKINIEQ